MPEDLASRVLERQKTQAQKRALAPPSAAGGTASAGEVKELKIKLSHKDKEIRELNQKLKDQQVFLDQKDRQLKEVEKERDALMLQNETMTAQKEKMVETLKQNNVEFDSKQFEAKAGGSTAAEVAQKQGLIEAYKAKLSKAQRDLDAKIRETQEKDQKYHTLKEQVERNDRILKKHMDENQQLKRQLAAGGGRGGAAASSPLPKTSSDSAPAKRDFKTMRAQRKEQAQKQIADFNQKFLSDLESQIDEMFVNAANRKVEKPDGGEEVDLGDGDEIDLALAGTGALVVGFKESAAKPVPAEGGDEAEEKQKILDGVRKMAVTMQSDIKDLLKNEWAGSIQTLEGEKVKAEIDRRESLKVAKNDEKAVLVIEKEHRAKMESLNGQV